jgi:eukaryotic-like serine/threonine-protein kinase
LVYGDISPNNIFISDSSQHTEVYLIDIDNLSYETNTPVSFIHTNPFGAPEVVLGQHGVDTLTDVYSFAVIAFMTLSLCHPLFGDSVIDGEPEIEDRALTGKLPWIFHLTDESNRSSHVLPREIVFSKKLFELFEATFGEGLLNRNIRPGISKWEERLSTALQFALTCPRCKGDFFRDATLCPWCNAPRPAYLLAVVDILSLNADHTLQVHKKAESGYCLQYPGNFVITRKSLGYYDDEADQQVIGLEIDSNLQIKVRSLDGKEYLATHTEWLYENGIENEGRKERIDRVWKSLRVNWRIHLGPIDNTHLVIRFTEMSH